MFYCKLISLFGGAFLEFVFVGLVFWISGRGRPASRKFFWTAALCLFLGAGLVMVHAVLARDLVLFVGQGIAGIVLYAWLRAHVS